MFKRWRTQREKVKKRTMMMMMEMIQNREIQMMRKKKTGLQRCRYGMNHWSSILLIKLCDSNQWCGMISLIRSPEISLRYVCRTRHSFVISRTVPEGWTWGRRWTCKRTWCDCTFVLTAYRWIKIEGKFGIDCTIGCRILNTSRLARCQCFICGLLRFTRIAPRSCRTLCFC